MSLVAEVKLWRYLLELCKDLIVSGHVCGQDATDHTFSHLTEHFWWQGTKYVAVIVFQYPECHGAVMVLQRWDVIIAQSQLCPCIYLPTDMPVWTTITESKSTSTLTSQDVPDRCCCSQDGLGHGKCKKWVRLVFPNLQSYWEVLHTTPWNTSETHKGYDSAEPETCVWWSELYKLRSVSIYIGCCLVLNLAQFLRGPALHIL